MSAAKHAVRPARLNEKNYYIENGISWLPILALLAWEVNEECAYGVCWLIFVAEFRQYFEGESPAFPPQKVFCAFFLLFSAFLLLLFACFFIYSSK